MRCDVFGASGHVTTKPSICKWNAFYKLGVYARKVKCLTLGGLLRVEGATENSAMGFDRVAEVSREHSKLNSTAEGSNKYGARIGEESIECI